MLLGRGAGLSGFRIRAERDDDRAAVRAAHLAAFPTSAEADLVDALRGAARPFVSIVAERDGAVVGHALFTPVAVGGAGAEATCVAGLAPMAVLPGAQRRGAGGVLVRAGLAACRDAGFRAVVVLGHADYYPRFGFRAAWEFGLHYGPPGPEPVFMALELEPGALADLSGAVRYHAAFDAL